MTSETENVSMAMTPEEAALRARHPHKHDPAECDGCLVFAIIDDMRTAMLAAIVQLENNCPNTQALAILRKAVQ